MDVGDSIAIGWYDVVLGDQETLRDASPNRRGKTLEIPPASFTVRKVVVRFQVIRDGDERSEVTTEILASHVGIRLSPLNQNLQVMEREATCSIEVWVTTANLVSKRCEGSTGSAQGIERSPRLAFGTGVSARPLHTLKIGGSRPSTELVNSIEEGFEADGIASEVRGIATIGQRPRSGSHD